MRNAASRLVRGSGRAPPLPPPPTPGAPAGSRFALVWATGPATSVSVPRCAPQSSHPVGHSGRPGGSPVSPAPDVGDRGPAYSSRRPSGYAGQAHHHGHLDAPFTEDHDPQGRTRGIGTGIYDVSSGGVPRETSRFFPPSDPEHLV